MAETTARLRESRRETADAVTLRFDVQAPFAYRAGQYLTIDPHQFAELEAEVRRREAERGKPLGPGYFSIASDGLDPGILELTLKLASPPPLLAGFLVQGLRPGADVRLQGPGGNYGLPEAPPAGITGFIHLCAGSGVVPNRGMVRHALGRDWPQRQLLLVQDRTAQDLLYAREWEDLQAGHASRLRVVLLFSRERGERINADVLRQAAGGFLDLEAAWGFACGPNQARPDGPGFVDRCRELLRSLGFPPERIRTE